MSCFSLNSPDGVWLELSPVSPRKITYRSQFFHRNFPSLSRCCGQGGEMTTNAMQLKIMCRNVPLHVCHGTCLC